MADVILFHSVLGLRPGIHALAERLTREGHPTRAPDLYDGVQTENVVRGLEIWNGIGAAALLARTRIAAEGLPGEAVLAGASAGGGLAGRFWAERPNAGRVIFLCGPGPIPVPPPSGAPVQMHMAPPDPFDDKEEVADWAARLEAQPLDVFRYDGVGHNFLNAGGPEGDEDATEACAARILAFLDGLRGGAGGRAP